jgi:hypothetical protein
LQAIIRTLSRNNASLRLFSSSAGGAKRSLKPEQLFGAKEAAPATTMSIPTTESSERTPWLLLATVSGISAVCGYLYKASDDVDVSTQQGFIYIQTSLNIIQYVYISNIQNN